LLILFRTALILDRIYKLALDLENKDYLGFVESQYSYHYEEKGELDIAIDFLKKSISHTYKPFYRIKRYLSLANLYQEKNEWGKYLLIFPLISKDLTHISTNSNSFNRLTLQHYLLYAKWLFYNEESLKATTILNTLLKQKNRTRSAYEAEAYQLLAQNATKEKKDSLFTKAIQYSLVDKNVNNLTIGNVLFPKQLIDAIQLQITSKDRELNPKNIEQYLNLIRQVQKAFPFEETKYSFQENIRPFLAQLIQKSSLDAEDIFQYIDYGKAGVLNQVVSDQKIKFGNVAPNLLKQEKSYARELTRLRMALAEEEDPSDSIINKIDEIRIQQSFLQKEMEVKSPSYYNLKYKDNIPEIKGLQKKLSSNKAILNYYKQGNLLFAVVLKQQEIKSYKINLPANFNQVLASFLKSINSNPGFGVYNGHKASQYLYSIIIRPMEKELNGISQLIILRDEELNELPFEVLESLDGKLFLEKYAISYNYSATLLSHQYNSRKLNGLLSIAPYADGLFLKSKTRDRNLGSLPFSTAEVDEIGGTIYKNKSATKNRFLQDYKKHSIIHFATHAQMDDKDPSRSFIAFYPDSTDYKLYTEELYNLSLQNTQLVVLSACEAGDGLLQKGEGLMSLARGFAYAGCPAVITTLWKAHDESTAWLSERLHHYLKKGWNKTEALRQAKIDFRNSDLGKEYDHPYYWANFILIGDDSPLEISFWENYMWWIIGSLFLLLLLGFFLRKK
jgi:CHAT domain-containing protein